MGGKGGGWTGRSQGNGLGYAIFIWTLRHGGVGVAYSLLWLVVPFYVVFSRRAYRAVALYYRRLLALQGLRLHARVWGHFFSFARTLVDRVAIRAGMENRFSFAFSNYSEFLAALDSGQGLVLQSAHVGCWDAGAGFFARAGAKRLFMLQMQAERADVQRQLDRAYRAADFTVLAPGECDALERMLQIKGILEKGGVLALMGDRYLPGEARMAIPFLGKEAHFPVNAYHIAARMRCPVWYYFAVREGRAKYRFIFVEGPKLKEPRDVLEGARNYVEQLEGVVRTYPDQWFNFYDFWANA